VQLISGQTYLAVVHIDVGLYYDLLRVSIITRNVDMGQRRPPYIGFGEFSHHWPPLSRRDELESREFRLSLHLSSLPPCSSSDAYLLLTSKHKIAYTLHR